MGFATLFHLNVKGHLEYITEEKAIEFFNKCQHISRVGGERKLIIHLQILD
jgi:hypothetical protein